jgi:hypothetical protein
VASTAVDSQCEKVGSSLPDRNGRITSAAHPGIEELSLPKHDITERFMALVGNQKQLPCIGLHAFSSQLMVS